MLYELNYGTRRKEKTALASIDPDIQAAIDAEAEQEVRKNGVIPHDETPEEQMARITASASVPHSRRAPPSSMTAIL